MGGFFGSVKKSSAVFDVFLGTDYHSHLGTKRGGMAAYDKTLGLQREIHNIENAPFRTKFERTLSEMKGNAAIGCISDTHPQPLLMVSKLGTYAICTIGIINNAKAIMDKLLARGGYFDAMTGSTVNSNEIVAALINSKDSYVEGIRYAQEQIEGTASILLLTDKGTLIAARDKFGRLPIQIGRCEDGYCVSFESFAYKKLGYTDERELGPAEIVEISADGVTQLAPAGREMRVCAFLWSYYGYPTSSYEGKNVEVVRCKNGAIFAENDAKTRDLHDVDYVGGVPDSGTPHAIGYANASQIPFARPYIKYTPTWSRSFMPVNQDERNKIAKMKLIPVHEFIEGKNLLLVDDSIVRGTQLKETVEFLYSHGAKAVHMRSACPPIMYGCKYLNFSRSSGDMDLITRRTIMELEGEEGFRHLEEYSDSSTTRGKAMRKAICDKFKFESLEFQSLEGLTEAIGIEPCKLCTYCWTGKE
ncbi:MAG TPA: amidophosphoribosyltransferase [Clostridiales bacterium]|nr:amidophosphoribosyltransferase [Clostridiales bacterium]